MSKRMICRLALLFAIPSVAQTRVLTAQYNNQRTNANVKETILNPSNVVPTKFGKLFSHSVDGAIVGQSLYLPAVSIPGKGTHNVVYAATMHDSIYAFDADTNSGTNAAPLWRTRVLPSGATPVPIGVQGAGGVTGWTEVGVVSTPVIDVQNGILYVVAKDYLHGIVSNRLHGLNVATGMEAFTPILIAASFASGGKTYVFNNLSQVNRPALLLASGILYIAFGSNGVENGKGQQQGWVLAYSAKTSTSMVKLLGAFNDEPGKGSGGIWQTGGGLSADLTGNVYAATADGPFVAGTNFGQSILKLTLHKGLQLADWFTPHNWAALRKGDLDLTISPLILPTQSGAHPNLAIGVGKEGTIYVLDRTKMGHLCTTCTHGDTQIVQELPGALGHARGMILSFAYWNGTVYTSHPGWPIKAWTLSGGLLPSTPTTESNVSCFCHSGVVSANGTANAILWELDGTQSNAQLLAFDAITLQQIYSARQAGTRDLLPPAAHFAKLMEIHGKVYVGTNSTLAVFGLL